MQFYGFLNKKPNKSSIKIKGKRVVRTLPVKMDEKLNSR